MQLSPEVLAGILSRLGIKALNDMQQAMLEAAATHDNVVLRSPTGSGKTLAFLLPLLQQLDAGSKETGAMVIAPSRELAQQIEAVWKSMGSGLKVTCCYGGHKRETEENNLTEPPALIIGTPGRLADHIRRGNITAASIHTLVLDEFDKSLELGFSDEMAEIIGALPALKKRILTSATESVDIPDFAGVADPVRLAFEAEDREEGYGLAVQVLHAADKDKLDTLFRLLCHLGARPTIIFCNHRESVVRTSEAMKQRGIMNVHYHGAMEQQERDAALCKFRNGSAWFLVTTDLAARGLDIAHIRYIVHYHLPMTADAFTHRNGRTARMDKTGTAIVMLGPEEELPGYIEETAPTELSLPAETGPLPDKPQWTTLFIAAGKKDKVNKVDIVGFLSHIAALKKEDIGLIEVKDFFSFAAIRKVKAAAALAAIRGEKIKGRKVKIEVAR
jgi:ATP-independent RNA helicase DbpA